MTKKYLIICLLFVGCSPVNTVIENVNNDSNMEIISKYDYDYYTGYNAALAQFGSGNLQAFDLSNKKIASYVSDKSDQGYADGYHKALDIINLKDNPQCPHVH
jgi:hypothetical protein